MSKCNGCEYDSVDRLGRYCSCDVECIRAPSREQLEKEIEDLKLEVIMLKEIIKELK